MAPYTEKDLKVTWGSRWTRTAAWELRSGGRSYWTGEICNTRWAGLWLTASRDQGSWQLSEALHDRQKQARTQQQQHREKVWWTSSVLWYYAQSVAYIPTFKLRTFSEANVRSHVQSQKLVHVSGRHGHVRASSTVVLLLCTVLLFQGCPEASRKAAVT